MRPYFSTARAASASTLSSLVTSVGTARTSTPCLAQLARRLLEGFRVEVGEHHAGAEASHAEGDLAADAARRRR